MKVTYKPAMHGLAQTVRIDGKAGIFGYVRRVASGSWAQKWESSEPWIEGFRTRTDATVALLLRWGGREAPTPAEIYSWVIEKTKE